MRRLLRNPEYLEKRQLMAAAVINEILIDRLFGNNNLDQYIELRGEPGASLSAGSYLVAVDSDKSFGNREGKIHNLFDLSNLTFGSNGFLVLQQQNSPFTADPAANILKSTQPGFAGLPGNIYSDSNANSDNLALWQTTFFLIQTAVKPLLGDDIDADQDGLVDPNGIAKNWNILDSITVMNSLSDGHAYGSIAFVSTNSVQVPQVTAAPGTTIVRPEGSGYVGRIGNSLGSAAEDWSGGTVTDDNNDEYFVRFAAGTFGKPAPLYMGGRELDNLGKENFEAAAFLQFFEDSDSDGAFDVGEPPLPGIKIRADLDGTQSQLFETIIEPDEFVSDRELDNLTPGVTLSIAGTDNVTIGFNVQSEENSASPNNRVFSHVGIPFINSIRRLRADFYRPAQIVSADFIGDSNSSSTYGRLEVFDANNNSLQMIRTGALRQGQVQQLTIDTGNSNIAYAIAYSDDDHLSSSPFGMVDRFVFSVTGPTAESDADGVASLRNLVDGSYSLSADLATQGDFLFELPGILVSQNSNFFSLISATKNEAPEFEDATLAISEAAIGGSSLGNITARDHVTQQVVYSLLSGHELFEIEASSGLVTLKNGVMLDFEQESAHVIRVKATDNAANPLSSERNYTITVLDANEAPSISEQSFSINEHPANGALIGTVVASDVDTGVNGQLNFKLISSLPGQPIGIDSQTGELTVRVPGYFNYETRQRIEVTVEALDAGTPALKSRSTVTINLSNINEPHVVSTTSLSIGELAPAGGSVGFVNIDDEDDGQIYQYQWSSGFTSSEFELNAATGEITLKDAVALSFNDNPLYQLKVTVIDDANPQLSDSADIELKILDENNLPELLSATLTIAENSAAGSSPGKITAEDVDLGQNHTFSLISGGQLFSIHPTTGVLSLLPAVALDFETGATESIQVKVDDSGTPKKSATRVYTVTITDINEAPEISDGEFSVDESSLAGGNVGKVEFSDPDASDIPTVSIVSGPDSNLFAINAETGRITLAAGAVLDFETTEQYTLTVAVTDGVNAPRQAMFTISVLDSNDPPTKQGDLAPISHLAGYPLSFVVPANAAVDQDVGQTVRYSIIAQSGDMPAWLSYNVTTRTLQGTPWNPNTGVVDLFVVASDNGSPKKSINIPLKLTVNFNEAPWKNINKPLDVNNNGKVTASDALDIINQLNDTGSFFVPKTITSRKSFMDVTGDSRVSATDALRVIDFLNDRANSNSEGEGQTDRLNVGPTAANPAMAVDFALLDWVESDRRIKGRSYR